jgi:hypothetical protein
MALASGGPIHWRINPMPRHYSPEERDYAIQRLIAHHGDIQRTAAEIGVSTRTLYNWRKTVKINLLQLQNLQQNSQIQPQNTPSIASDDLQTFRHIQAGMLHNVNLLNASVAEAIEEATLGQRVTALIQLTDRIIKLAAQLPQPEEDIEYVLTDDVEEEDEEEI